MMCFTIFYVGVENAKYILDNDLYFSLIFKYVSTEFEFEI